jgi:hypothetical protein
MFVVGVLLAIAVGEKMVIAITRRAAFEIVDRHLGNAADEYAEGGAQDEERYVPPPSDEGFHDQNRKYRNSVGRWVIMNDTAIPKTMPAAMAHRGDGTKRIGWRNAAMIIRG